jgi:hypothetical protein
MTLPGDDELSNLWKGWHDVLRALRLQHQLKQDDAFRDLSDDAVALIAVLALRHRRALGAELLDTFPSGSALVLVAAMDELRSLEMIFASWAASEDGKTIELVLILSDDVEIPELPA